jgi:ketosteroid isomerase-like protein
VVRDDRDAGVDLETKPWLPRACLRYSQPSTDDLWKNAGLRFDLGVIQTVAGEDIGYLVGTYVAHMGDQSVPGVTHEAYRRQSDGSWKCTVDMWHHSVE